MQNRLEEKVRELKNLKKNLEEKREEYHLSEEKYSKVKTRISEALDYFETLVEWAREGARLGSSAVCRAAFRVSVGSHAPGNACTAAEPTLVALPSGCPTLLPPRCARGLHGSGGQSHQTPLRGIRHPRPPSTGAPRAP
mgnify:CR=1 FL=1